VGAGVCERVVEPETNGREKGRCSGAFMVSPTQQAWPHLTIFSLQPIPGGASEQLLQILGESIVNVVLKGQALAGDMRRALEGIRDDPDPKNTTALIHRGRIQLKI